MKERNVIIWEGGWQHCVGGGEGSEERKESEGSKPNEEKG